MGSSLEAPMYSLQVSMKHDIVFLALLLLFLSRSELVAAQQNTPDPYTYSRLSPSMAVIVVVLIAALFFMGFFSVYIRHCSGTGADAGPRPFAALSRRSAAARGLEPSVIETFPTFVYSVVKGLKLGKGALECAVCLNEFEDDETLRLIPKCDHVFHPECIDAWLSSHTTCPVCRSNLAAQPGDSPPGQAQPAESQDRPESDIESQHDAVESEAQDATATANVESASEPQVIAVDEILKRNRTRGSRSGRARLKLPRSHSTGHSLVQPGEDTERFTLRLPVEVRKQLMNRKLNRSTSLVVLPRESSSRRGYRNGIDGGSSRGKSTGYRRLERPDGPKLDRWASFIRTPSFFLRASSLKSPRVASNTDSQSNSARPVGPESSTSGSLLPPV